MAMEMDRRELLPGAWLTSLRTDKFKTGTLSVSLLSQLDAQTAAMNALLPRVLRRGTSRLSDMEKLAAYMDELYGTAAEAMTRRIGEVQATGFMMSFPEARYLPAGEGDMLRRSVGLLGELLLSPETRGGLLLPDYVQSERGKLAERIRAQRNDKDSWAVQRMRELMCAYEPFAVGALGSEEAALGINYTKLTRHYRSLVAASPIELIYCGGETADAVADALTEALTALPRGEIDYELGTDVRMNAVEDKPRRVTERAEVIQAKLAIGWRLGDCMEDADEAAIRLFNTVYGGGVTSRLFMNVRERLSLCYYASSSVDIHKGLLCVSSGVATDKLDEAENEIFAQLDSLRRGEVEQEELDAAKRYLASQLRAINDSPWTIESYWLGANLDGRDASPEELAAAVEAVTAEEVIEIARSVDCDMIYRLVGGEEGEDD